MLINLVDHTVRRYGSRLETLTRYILLDRKRFTNPIYIGSLGWVMSLSLVRVVAW